MTTAVENVTILTTKVEIKPESVADFADWQAQLNAAIAAFPGFVSLEILSPVLPERVEWLLVQRFYTSENLRHWERSDTRRQLVEKLGNYLVGTGKEKMQESFSSATAIEGGVTEVFITQVLPQNEAAYRAWMAKIHQSEAKFPGFRGVYMQSPSQSGGVNWITLLQFDTPENLDRWLNSPEGKRSWQKPGP